MSAPNPNGPAPKSIEEQLSDLATAAVMKEAPAQARAFGVRLANLTRVLKAEGMSMEDIQMLTAYAVVGHLNLDMQTEG